MRANLSPAFQEKFHELFTKLIRDTILKNLFVKNILPENQAENQALVIELSVKLAEYVTKFSTCQEKLTEAKEEIARMQTTMIF